MHHFLNPFLKIAWFTGESPQTSAGNWFQSCMVLFTKEYFPTSVFCFLLLIFLSRSTLAFAVYHLWPFRARSPVYALKGAHMRASSCAAPRFPSSDHSSDPPCKDPNMTTDIQELVELVICRHRKVKCLQGFFHSAIELISRT
jgi:hypothetical protein